MSARPITRSHQLATAPPQLTARSAAALLVALAINETGSYSWFPAMARQLLFDVPEGAGPQKGFWTLNLAERTLYWTEGHENGLMPDAQFDAIMAELRKVKQMIRQLQHG